MGRVIFLKMIVNRELKMRLRIRQIRGNPAQADYHSADAEVTMQTKILLLMPVLVAIAGCSDKIEAHENETAPSKIGMPPNEKEASVEDPEEQETDLELRSPVGLD